MSDETKKTQGGTIEEIPDLNQDFEQVEKPEPPPQKEEKGEESYARKVFKTKDGKLDPDKLADAYDELYRRFTSDLAAMKNQVGKTAEVTKKLGEFEERLNAVTSLEEKLAQVLDRLESRGGVDAATEAETDEAMRSAGIEPDSEEGREFRNFLEYYNSEFDPEGAYRMFKKELEQQLSAVKPQFQPETILKAIEENPELQRALAEKLAEPIHQTIQAKEKEQRFQQDIKKLVDQGHDEATVFAAVAYGVKKGADDVMQAWNLYQQYLADMANQKVNQQLEKETANQLKLRQEVPRPVDGALDGYEETRESPFAKVLAEAEPKSELY